MKKYSQHSIFTAEDFEEEYKEIHENSENNWPIKY